MGTLMKKIQCQLKLSVIQPPRVGPMAGAHDDGHAVDGEGLPALFDGEGVGEDGLFDWARGRRRRALQDAGEDEEGQAGAKPQRMEQRVKSATQVM